MINTSSYLYKLIAYSLQKKFTGKIVLSSPNNVQWIFYFFAGNLNWIEGGFHPHRIWLRHIIQYLSEINIDTIKFNSEEKYVSYQYQVLKTILKQNLAEQIQIEKMLLSRTKEIFGDIFHEESQRKLEIKIIPASYEEYNNFRFESSLKIADLKELLQIAQQDYIAFLQQSKVSFSLNYAPFIADKEALRDEVSPHIYQTFLQYFNGQNPLKSIAFKLDKDLYKLALSIVPYLKKKIIKLAFIDDLPPYVTVDKYFSSSDTKNLQANKSAIACVDDSLLICKMMNTIINKAGHQFIGINEPLQAIPQLIQAKPRLIFVDLAMPLINGYQLCTQIKKVSQLKEIPLVMLTGKDCMEERVKAKVVGITDFIGKPIVEDKIINAIERYAK